MGSITRNIPDPMGMLQDPSTIELIDSVDHGLPGNSKVLFVGCSASLPIILHFSSQKHEIHGIDGSQAHLDTTASLVSGHFELANETEYQFNNHYPAIFALFSLYHLSRAETHSLIYKIGEALMPGGVFVLGTSLSDHLATDQCQDRFEDCIRGYPLSLNGDELSSTIYSRKGWVTLCKKAGLTLDSEAILPGQGDIKGGVERYDFMTFRKTEDHAILGPYPLPASYRGPIPLSEAAWKPFAERLVRDEFDFVLEVLKNNQKVLDVGSGYGKLPMEIAARSGKAYSIEPNPDRNSIQAAKAHVSGVEISQGSAENIPYADGFFDAVAAMWVLHYVDDLDKSLRELVRVTNSESPYARIVIVQGTPDNEIIDLMNSVCAPISASNKHPNHQGYLLHKAAEVFSELGFSDISFHRVEAYCQFLEEDLSMRCEKAAEVVAGLWCLEDEKFEDMKAALIPRIKFNFQDRPHAIGDQVAILVARPAAKN